MQKKLLVVLLVCFVGSFMIPLDNSYGAISDETSAILYETGIRNDLQFKLVNDEYTRKAKDEILLYLKNNKIPDNIVGQNLLLLQISKDIELPHELELLFRYIRDKNDGKLYPREILSVDKASTLGGDDISEVWLDLDSFDTPVIDFQMNSRGAEKFRKLTGIENKGKRLAIIINNKIRTAPIIEEEIVKGGGSIFGDFSKDEAEEFVQMFMNSSASIGIE